MSRTKTHEYKMLMKVVVVVSSLTSVGHTDARKTRHRHREEENCCRNTNHHVSCSPGKGRQTEKQLTELFC